MASSKSAKYAVPSVRKTLHSPAITLETAKPSLGIAKDDENLRGIFASCPEAMIVADLDGFIINCNQAALVLHGYPSKEEIIGKSAFEFFARKDRLRAMEDLKRTMEQGVVRNAEYTLIAKDGREFPTEISASIIKDSTGKLYGFVVVTKDISERKRMEEALAHERDLLHALMDNMPDSIFFKDLNFRLTRINKKHARSLGLKDPAEAMGKTDFDLFPKRFAQETRLDEEEIFRTGKPLIGKLEEAEAPPGVVRWYSTTKVPIRDSEQRIIGLVGSTRDITDIKRMEEALAHERDLLHALMDNIPDTIYFKDTQSRFTRINKAQVKVLGVKDAEEAIGKTDFDYFTEEHARDAYEDEQKIVKLGAPLISKIEKIRRADGQFRWVSATKVPIKDKEGKVRGIVGISRDVTDIKQMEDKLEEANVELRKRLKELQDLQKLLQQYNELLQQSNEDLENYTYVVSHDLKAPLRAIRSFGTFLLEDYGDKIDETGKEYLKRIEKAAAHMNQLIEDLLLLSRVGRKFTEVEKVNLNEVLDEIVSYLKPTIESRNAEVVINQLPDITTQRVWVKQLFMNLIDNGLKFNKSTIPRVKVSYEDRLEDYLFKVRDNGIGIEEKYLTRIFNLFERLHSSEEYEGTGAGLAICKKIVGNFGGKIWVESTVGKGSTFCFTMLKK